MNWQLFFLIIFAVFPFILWFWIWSDTHQDRCACDDVRLPDEYGTVTVGATTHGRFFCGP